MQGEGKKLVPLIFRELKSRGFEINRELGCCKKEGKDYSNPSTEVLFQCSTFFLLFFFDIMGENVIVAIKSGVGLPLCCREKTKNDIPRKNLGKPQQSLRKVKHGNEACRAHHNTKKDCAL